jgi:hypothetical protein
MIMRRQGSVWLVAAVLALGAAACFSDPTKALRNGATRLQLSQYTVTLKAGDSLSVRAYVLDDQGNQLDVGTPTWTSADPTIATARADAAAPGDVFSNGVVVGVNNQAGVTDVTVTIQGVQATVRVTVLPATFPGAHPVTGTAVTDTFIVNRPAPLAALVVPYTSGDTLVLTATATVTFSATSSTVAFGAFNGYIVSRTATVIKAMSRQPFMGKPVVTNLTYSSGNAATGPIAIASMPVDSITIQHSRFHGTAAVVGDTITLTASTLGVGSSFSGTTGLQFSGVPATIFSQTASTIRAIAPILTAATYTGGFTIYNLGVGATTVDSAHSFVSVTMNRATYPGASAAVSADTLIVSAPTGATFDTTTATVAGARFGGTAAVLFAKSPTQLKFINQRASYTGALTVRRLVLGIATVDSLTTTGNITIGQASFPGASAAVSADTLIVTAPTGTTFDTTTATVAGAKFGGTAGTLIAKSPTQLNVLDVDTVGYVGILTVRRVKLGLATIDSLKTTGNVTMTKATFSGTIATLGKLLDTATVYSTAAAKFTTGAAGSVVTIGGQPAWSMSRTADSIKVIPAAGSSGPITISKVKVGLASVSLPSVGSVAISATTSGEVNEPGNNTSAGATAFAVPARTADSSAATTVIGAVDTTDADDWYTLTTVDSAKVRAVSSFLGTGAGSGGSPDLDVKIYLSDGATNPAGGSAATKGQPEVARTTALMPPGTYFIRVHFNTTGASTRAHETYNLTVSRIYP